MITMSASAQVNVHHTAAGPRVIRGLARAATVPRTEKERKQLIFEELDVFSIFLKFLFNIMALLLFFS